MISCETVPTRSRTLVVVSFEHHAFDDVVGHPDSPADGKDVDGVIGTALSTRSRLL